MGGTCGVRGEPGKQNPRSCRAQELARSRAQENARQKKGQPTELDRNRVSGDGTRASASEKKGRRTHLLKTLLLDGKTVEVDDLGIACLRDPITLHRPSSRTRYLECDNVCVRHLATATERPRNFVGPSVDGS